MLYQRLIYRSRVVANENLDKDMSRILDVSRRLNRARDITGALICFDDSYVQVLEGPPAQIEGLMAVIERDPRHCDIRVLGRWAASHRLFGGWSMASAPAFEIAVETRQNFVGSRCGLEMLKVMTDLTRRLPVFI